MSGRLRRARIRAQRCVYFVPRAPGSLAPRGDLVPCGRRSNEHPVIDRGHFGNHLYAIFAPHSRNPAHIVSTLSPRNVD